MGLYKCVRACVCVCEARSSVITDKPRDAFAQYAMLFYEMLVSESL